MYLALGDCHLDKLHPTVVAMMGVLACVVTGSLTWDDILGERTGWDILIWMGTLVGMAGLLGKLGVVAVFANFVSQHLVGIDWFWASFIISATFVYSQYFLLAVRRVLPHYSPPLQPFWLPWVRRFHLPSCSLV